MANWNNHIKQAKHNEKLAEQLVADAELSHWDWLITIAFYSAVHYVESVFFFTEIVHTETACLDGNKHAFRLRNVRQQLGHECWKSYRKLQDASYNVRYLALANEQPTAIAIGYYSLNDAKRLYNFHLAKVRKSVLDKLAE